ncbi:MAG: hypothetical protein LBF37_03005, partial [Rickettsiales bacterium]|nr:hypothetical protein [Rickettsiales bacterium]
MIDINKKIFLDNAEFMDKLKLASLYLKAKKIIESSNETIETATRQLHEARTSQDRGECFEAIKEANGKISSAMELVYRQMDKVKIPRDTNLDKLKLDCRIATQKDMENNACYVLKAPYSKPGLQECLAWVVEQAKRTELKQLGKISRTLK